jgi:hypothetical protein
VITAKPASRASIGAWLAAAIVVVVGFWALSWQRTATWLDADARRAETQWAAGLTPWQWSFDRVGDVVWPGSHGFVPDPVAAGAFEGTIPNGVAEFSFALRGRRIDAALVSAAELHARLPAGSRLIVLGDSANGTATLSDTLAAATDAALRLPITASADSVWSGLRLRIETLAGARVALARLRLVPARVEAAQDCSGFESIADTLARCDAHLLSLRAPAMLRPESMLQWRDFLLEQRPAAIVRAAAVVPVVRANAPRDAVARGPHPAWFVLALGSLPLIALVSSARRALPRPRRAGLELALALAPALALLWSGALTDDTPREVALVFGICLGSALLLRDPAPDWGILGAARAWRGVASLALIALPVLAATAIANAVDADGFQARALAADKFWQYPLWVVLQQWLLMRTIAPRLRLAFGSEHRAALAAGALFGLLHLPNLSLMLATFVAGSAWAWLGYRDRALLPLVVSHLVLGLAWLWLAPPWLLRSAEIGARFLMPP